MNALIKPIIVPSKQAFQKFTPKIIFDSATFKKTKSIKTERAKNPIFAVSIGDVKKLIREISPTTIAKYIITHHEVNILSFRKMLKVIYKTKASATACITRIIIEGYDITQIRRIKNRITNVDKVQSHLSIIFSLALLFFISFPFRTALTKHYINPAMLKIFVLKFL